MCIDFKKLAKSFHYAGRGFYYVLKNEQNFRVQLFLGLLAIAIGIFFRIKLWEIVALIFSISLVLILELVNTIFERFIDILRPRVHSYVQIIKDIMAAAVLVASLCALVLGILVFAPRIIDLISR